MESEKKLEQTKVNLLRINDIVSEIESNIGPLKNQSEKARTLKMAKNQLSEFEHCFVSSFDARSIASLREKIIVHLK